MTSNTGPDIELMYQKLADEAMKFNKGWPEYNSLEERINRIETELAILSAKLSN